jgi:hypothetical protein
VCGSGRDGVAASNQRELRCRPAIKFLNQCESKPTTRFELVEYLGANGCDVVATEALARTDLLVAHAPDAG